MEITGINEAAQLINVTINGVDTTLKLTGSFLNWSLNSLITFGKFIAVQINKSKVKLKPGEMNFGDMLSRMAKTGAEPALYNIDDNYVEEITGKLNELKIPYSIFPDLDDNDGVKQVMIPDEYKTSMLAFSNEYNVYEGENKHIVISRTTFNEYIKNGDSDVVQKLFNDLSEEQQKQLDSYIELGKQVGEKMDWNSADLKDLNYWNNHDIHCEVLVINDLGLDPQESFNQENNIINYFKTNNISIQRLPDDSNGRKCFLFDSSKSISVRKEFNDNIIQVSNYLQNMPSKFFDSGYYNDNKIVFDNLQNKGIDKNIFNNKEYSDEIVLSPEQTEGRFIWGDDHIIRFKVLDYGYPPSEGVVDIPKDRIRIDNENNYHILFLKDEKLYLSYDKNINSKISEKSKYTIISGRNLKQFNDNFISHINKTIVLDDKKIDLIKPVRGR